MTHARLKRVRQIVACVIAVTALVLLVLVFTPDSIERPASSRSVSLALIKQLGVTVNIYMSDADDHFPLDVSSVAACHDALFPYAKNESIFHSLNPESPEFLGNGSLAGRLVTTIPDPDHTILFFDSAPWDDMRRGVTLTDTSARRFAEKEFQVDVSNHWVHRQSIGAQK